MPQLMCFVAVIIHDNIMVLQTGEFEYFGR